MRTTETPRQRRLAPLRAARMGASAALLSLTFVALVVLIGCSTSGADKGTTGADGGAPVGKSMAGPAQKIVISKQAAEDKPEPWVLSNPQDAVRSYLDWMSYAYRITESAAAKPTMSAKQEVRVDSYLQLNLQKSQLLDQTLESISFGKPSVGSTSTVLPATERWKYRYVSTKDPAKVLGGPYTAEYQTTYTLIKRTDGNWVVDDVKVKALGEIK